jgi:hypothetical protein
MLAAQMESDDVQTVDVEVFDPLGLSGGMSSSGETSRLTAMSILPHP